MLPIIKNARHLVSRNASDLLSIGGVGCILTGGVLAIRKTPEAVLILDRKKKESNLEKVKAVAPLFIPAVGFTVVGIVQIVCSRNITKNKITAITTAYTVTETAYKTYRDKVKEVVKPEQYEDIQREVAREKVRRDPVGNKEVVMTNKGDVLIYDSMSGRYFKGSMTEIERAANIINKNLMSEMTVQLNDFYVEIGLEAVKMGCEMGWSIDDSMLEVRFDSTIAESGEPCLVLDYDVVPIN